MKPQDDIYNPLNLELSEVKFIEDLTKVLAQLIFTENEECIQLHTNMHQGSESLLNKRSDGDESEVCGSEPSSHLRRVR